VKHHYVPACYLGAFVDPVCPPTHEPYLWVVDLDEGTVRRRSPDNTAALTDYYAVGEGPNRYDVEEYLSAVESQTAPVLVKLLGDCPTVEDYLFSADRLVPIDLPARVKALLLTTPQRGAQSRRRR
jgi:uncharacterized protein DUF4238